MNLTISFNPEYISNQLKFKSDKIIGSNRIASLIRLLKKKQIILLIDREADTFQAKRVGADGYLLKPIDKTNLKNLFT